MSKSNVNKETLECKSGISCLSAAAKIDENKENIWNYFEKSIRLPNFEVTGSSEITDDKCEQLKRTAAILIQ